MNIVLSFSALCILLVVGKILRVEIRLFQKLYLPASVIGGLLGLVLVQTISGYLPEATTAGWNRLPGFLINIVFSALFLGVFIPPIRRIWAIAGPQLAYGQIVAWGQYVVGLGVAIVLLTPMFGVPAAIGTIIPVGFEGGHGTAAGLEPVFDAYDWPEGKDLALTSATCGVLFAIIVGMALVNWAARRSYTQQLKRIEDMPESSMAGIYEPAERPSAGSQTVSASSIDSLGLHLAIIGIGIFIGYLIHNGLVHVELLARPSSVDGRTFFDSFPLFPLCMIGGLVVQLFFANFTKRSPIDHRLMQRLSGTAMDFLVVARSTWRWCWGSSCRWRSWSSQACCGTSSASCDWGAVYCQRIRGSSARSPRWGSRWASPLPGSCCCASSIPKARPTPPRPSDTSSSCASRSWVADSGPAPPFRWHWPTISCGCSVLAPRRLRSGCWCGRCSFAVGLALLVQRSDVTVWLASGRA